MAEAPRSSQRNVFGQELRSIIDRDLLGQRANIARQAGVVLDTASIERAEKLRKMNVLAAETAAALRLAYAEQSNPEGREAFLSRHGHRRKSLLDRPVPFMRTIRSQEHARGYDDQILSWGFTINGKFAVDEHGQVYTYTPWKGGPRRGYKGLPDEAIRVVRSFDPKAGPLNDMPGLVFPHDGQPDVDQATVALVNFAEDHNLGDYLPQAPVRRSTPPTEA